MSVIQFWDPFFFYIHAHIHTHRPLSSVPPWTDPLTPLQDHLRKEKLLPQQCYTNLPRILTYLYVETYGASILPPICLDAPCIFGHPYMSKCPDPCSETPSSSHPL